MIEDRGINHSETIIETQETEPGSAPVVLAQANTGAGQTSVSAPGAGPSSGSPGIAVIIPDADNRVRLEATASIEEIQLDGDDLLLMQPDGSQIRIVGGALDVPTFIIGEIEVPQEGLVAALNSNGFNVAAGPGNTLSVSPQTPTGSGGDFEDSGNASIAGDGLQTLSLLGDTSLSDGSGDGGELLDEGNIASVFAGGASSGGIVESADNPGGTDANPVAATGSIFFFDPDFGETRSADVATRTVVSQALNNGGTLTAAQLDALLAGFSLDTVGGITVESTTAAGGSINWTYFVTNDAIDFLAAGEVITLSFDVRIVDGIFSAFQAVTITVTGTNDAPVITSAAQAVTLQEAAEQAVDDPSANAGNLTAVGTFNFTDVDISDVNHTAGFSAASSGATGGLAAALATVGTTLEALFAVTPASSAVSQDGTVAWTFSGDERLFDYLSNGESLVLTYLVTVTDTNGAASNIQTVTITIEGRNDAPVIGVIAQTDLAEQADSAALTSNIAVTFTDLDLTDTGHTATVTAAGTSGATTGLALDETALIALVTPGSVTKDSGNSAGSMILGFSAASTAFDYLATGEVLTLTYTLAIDDGDGGVTNRDFVVTITGTNDAPVIALIGQTDLTEQTDTSALVRDIAVSFTDVDLTDTGHTATVTAAAASGVTTGLALDEAALIALVTPGSVTKDSGNSAGSVILGFSAASTAFDYLATGEVLTLTYTLAIDDGDGGVTNRDFVVTITGTNDAPVISDVDAVLAYTENDAATVIDSSITLTDVDDTNLEGATVAITGNFATGEDVLGFVDQNGITGSYNAATGVLTLTGSATKAQYEAALESVTYRNTSENPSGLARTVSYSVTDGDAASNTGTATVNVTPVNDAPVLSTAPGVSDIVSFASFTTAAGAGHAIATGDITASGPGTADRLYAIVGDGDKALEAGETGFRLGDNMGGGILASNDTSDPVIVTSSNKVEFSNADGFGIDPPPANAGDFHLDSNDALDFALTGGRTVERVEFTVNAANASNAGVSIDVDGDLTNGAFSLGSLVDGAQVVIDFLAKTVKADGVDVTPAGFFAAAAAAGNDNITIGSTTASGFALDNLQITRSAAPLVFVENGTSVVLDAQITVADVDDTNLESATITITNLADGADEVISVDTTGTTIVASYVNGVLTLTGSATLADYQQVLRTAEYRNNSENPTGGNRTIEFSVNDGDDNSNVRSVSVNVTSVNDAPVISDVDAVLAYSENDAATVIDSSITLTDVDDTNLEGATVAITGNFATGEDVLGFVDQNGITGSYNDATGVLTLTGSATKAQYEAALESVTYRNTSENPSGLARTVSYSVTDGDAASNTGTATVNVTPVNDAPVISDVDAVLAYTENDAATVIDSSITLTDVDDTNLEGATVAITGNFATGEDVLGFVDQNGITGSYNAATGVLTLTGSATKAQYEAALESVTYRNTSTTPSELARTVSYSVTDGDAASNTGTATVNVTGVANATTYTYTTGQTVVLLSGPNNNSGVFTGNAAISNFSTAVDKINLVGTPTAAADTGGTVDGANSFFRLQPGNNNEASYHSISNGMVTFYNIGGTAVALTSISGVTGAIDYLQRNDIGDAGATVAFTATISAVNHTYIYQQVGATPNAANDILIDLVGVTIANLATLIGTTIDPIIFDLNGDGLDFTGTSFDLDNDGTLDSIGWPSGGDALLVADLDGSGAIENGSEVFSPGFNGGNFADSLEALASLDSNGDGRIDAADAQFGDVKLWIDSNGDGMTDAGELLGLADAGIATINLDANASSYSVDGQHVFAEGTFERTDGSTGAFFGLDLGPFTDTGTPMISGGAADDILIGGLGKDTLTGGLGADTFVFSADALSDAGLGIQDLIADYDFSGDVVDLSELLGLEPVDQVNAMQYVRMNGNFLEVDVNGGGDSFVAIAEFGVAPSHDALKILVDDATSSTVII